MAAPRETGSRTTYKNGNKKKMNAHAFFWTAIASSLTVLALPGSAPMVAQALESPDTRGLRVIAGTDIPLAALTEEAGLSSRNVYGIAQNAHGFPWCATGRFRTVTEGAMALLDRHTGHLTRQAIGTGLRDAASLNAISTVHEDATGALWLGTGEAGILPSDPTARHLMQCKPDPTKPHSSRNSFQELRT
ncbi:hypothetical protein [Hydrogenophaga taeniospiralis]|nr:hypothetical protein [Hydrogenophaga taeniospiralis]